MVSIISSKNLENLDSIGRTIKKRKIIPLWLLFFLKKKRKAKYKNFQIKLTTGISAHKIKHKYHQKTSNKKFKICKTYNWYSYS